MQKPENWLYPTPRGLYLAPCDVYIDPPGAVDRAIITHGHGDHARSGHARVLATRETLAIMAARYGGGFAGETQALAYGETLRLGDVTVTLHPAGHILGSAQIAIEHQGQRAIVSGDYKRAADPTCPPFEARPCDVFVTEATFGLPVFRHPDPQAEIAKLLASARRFADRAHLVGAYALGKCQRVIALLRLAGYDAPIYLHGAQIALCELYARLGVALGDLRPLPDDSRTALKGAIVLAPPSALNDRWSRRLPDPVTAMASGWMRIKQRAKQSGIELPLVISDHAGWDELTATLDDVAAPEIWVTHGNEEALVHHATLRGFKARALALVGYGDES